MGDEADLSGKAVVVTGGGRGIGAAVAKAVAAAGAAVVVNDMDAAPANECATAIRTAGGRAVAHVADVAVWSQAEGLIERCLEEYGKIDGLVNNAGVHLPKRSWEMDEASVRKTLEINVLGTLACAGRALKAMREQGFGSIVNTTSGSQMGHEYRPDYSASKGAVSSFTFTAAVEMQGTGVRVNAMSPYAETRMLDNMDKFMKTQGGWRRPSLPPPETNVGIHLYLLSDLSRHVNGQIIGLRLEGDLYIAGHPAILEPTAKAPGGVWTAKAIADAIDKGLVASLQPLGFTRLRQPSSAR
ncbi:MAG TPA: SDR family oxidoreductase [Candidatus Binataceae bacterium]|jgi:NAD(P)-dependent dehydrogenase (short-subunit alcohol dehydrogenase family)|nr:SDR family oxidoreductase [Candidatus Binataceae bacterium]